MRKWINGILITLLLAGGAVLCFTRWQAWFGMPAEPAWNGDILDYTFACPADTDSVRTILVLGDIHNRLQREEYDTLAARVPDINAVAQLGDWLDRGQEYYYQLFLLEWTNSALDSTPVIACPGNHEYSKGIPKTASEVWEKAFPHPHNGPVEVPGDSYYLDLPYARFIIIDTNPLTRVVYLTRTLTWLRALMYGAQDKFIVVMMHHPVLSVGKGRANTLIYTTFRYALGQADLVLAGHDHSYMRHAPFVVMNTAGKAKQQKFHFTPEKTDSVPVYGVLSLSPDTLCFKAYHLSDGSAIDSLYVMHD